MRRPADHRRRHWRRHLQVTVVFSEAMDAGVDPTLTFAPAVASTLSLAGGSWSAGNRDLHGDL